MNIDKFLEIKKTYKLDNYVLNSKLDEIIKLIKSKKRNIYIDKKNYKPIKPTNLKSLKNNNQNQSLIISNLNKLTEKNYDKLTKEIIELTKLSDIYDFLISNIFDIAIKQHNYSKLYVNLLYDLSKINNNIQNFIDLKCDEFKNITVTNNSKDSIKMEYDEFCENNIKKNKKIGYSQFIGQLFLKDMISYEISIGSLQNLFLELKQILIDNKVDYIEDYIICISKLFATIYDKIKVEDLVTIQEDINIIISNEHLIKRLKFKLMDLKDKINLN